MITNDLIQWLDAEMAAATVLDARGKPVQCYQGPLLPHGRPTEHVVITPVPGGRMTCEGMLEQAAYQIRVIGPQGRNTRSVNETAARSERLARWLDGHLLTVERPVIGGSQVVAVTRLGSAPTGQPLDDAGRFSFSAIYLFEAESGLNFPAV